MVHYFSSSGNWRKGTCLKTAEGRLWKFFI